MQRTHTHTHKKIIVSASRYPISASKKLQSAMEYLMTYGWAILIIAVVLVALFQMGVFDSANFAPKAQPGSCQVFKTVEGTSLEGTCNNELPQYVAQFAGNANGGSYISSSVQLNTATTTISVWFNPPATSIEGDIIRSCTAYSWSVVVSGVTRLVNFEDGWVTGSDTWWSSNVNVNAHTWNNVVYIMNRNTGALTEYMNGAFAANAVVTSSGSPPITQNFDIGQNGCYYAMNGLISNVQIYNTSLSANDVQALYQEGIGGAPQNTQNLVGWWPLNGNANDYSGNNNNGAATNVIYTGSWESGYSQP